MVHQNGLVRATVIRLTAADVQQLSLRVPSVILRFRKECITTKSLEVTVTDNVYPRAIFR